MAVDDRPDACVHEDWQANVTVIRLTETEDGPITGWSVEFEMSCVLCLTPMVFESLMKLKLTRISLPCYPFDVEAAGGAP